MCPVGDVEPSLAAIPAFVVVPLQLLIPLGVGLFDLFVRLEVEELPSAVPIEVGARSFVLEPIPGSSLLIEGRKDLASSLLLLCR